MSPKKRELILTIADGNPECFPILYHFDKFKFSEEIFKYLVREKIVGKKFVEIYQNEFRLSWLSMGKWIIMKIKKEREYRPIFAGKDYLV